MDIGPIESLDDIEARLDRVFGSLALTIRARLAGLDPQSIHLWVSAGFLGTPDAPRPLSAGEKESLITQWLRVAGPLVGALGDEALAAKVAAAGLTIVDVRAWPPGHRPKEGELEALAALRKAADPKAGAFTPPPPPPRAAVAVARPLDVDEMRRSMREPRRP